MKVSVNDVELFQLSDIKCRVICNEISEDIFEADMKRRLEWILMHKYEECFKQLKAEWEPKLIAEGAQSLPVNPDAFAELVFAHPEYKSKKQKLDAEQSL